MRAVIRRASWTALAFVLGAFVSGGLVLWLWVLFVRWARP